MRARVYNDNIYPHKEMFKEKLIEIPAKGFVDFDAVEDAIEFKGQFTPLRTDGEKNPLPQFFKMIRIEPFDGPAPAGGSAPLVCHATGKVAANQAELDRMNAEHIDKLDGESKKQLEEMAGLKAENEALAAKVAELERLQADAGVGAGEPDDEQRRSTRVRRS